MALPVGFAAQACGVTTFSTSPVTTVLTTPAPASATLREHVGDVLPPSPCACPFGSGNEQADTAKQPTAVQSNDLSNFMFCI